MAQLLIAGAVMVLGFDALNALETGSIDPLAGGALVALVTNRVGLTDGLDLAGLVALADGWPAWGAAPYGFLVAAPAFVTLGVLGILMALLFRARR
jgi:hypothetical protein